MTYLSIESTWTSRPACVCARLSVSSALRGTVMCIISELVCHSGSSVCGYIMYSPYMDCHVLCVYSQRYAPGAVLCISLYILVSNSCLCMAHNIPHLMPVTRKQTLRSFVVVIPKEGWARMAVPIFLWVWYWLLENMKSKDSNSKKLVSYHPSFVMAMTKTLRSVFSWRASYDAISWIWLYALVQKEQNILECFTRKPVEWVPFNVLVIDVKAWERWEGL